MEYDNLEKWYWTRGYLKNLTINYYLEDDETRSDEFVLFVFMHYLLLHIYIHI